MTVDFSLFYSLTIPLLEPTFRHMVPPPPRYIKCQRLLGYALLINVFFVYNVLDLDRLTFMEIHTLRAPRGLEFCVKGKSESECGKTYHYNHSY